MNIPNNQLATQRAKMSPTAETAYGKPMVKLKLSEAESATEVDVALGGVVFSKVNVATISRMVSRIKMMILSCQTEKIPYTFTIRNHRRKMTIRCACRDPFQ